MIRSILSAALVCGLSALLIAAQENPEFEVATVKPSKSAGVSLRLSPSGLFETTGTSLRDLIKFAYDLHPREIIGGPSWLETEKYDVTGKPDKPGKPDLNRVKVMVQKLLADRFQITFHRDKRELSLYAVKVAKSGAKLTKNDSDPNGLPNFTMGPRELRFRNATMAEFAGILQGVGSIVDRPVVDQTGLGSTRYDFILRWTPNTSQPPADNADAPPGLFTAFQEQLGLKLEPTKAPADVLAIDHAERPSAN